MEKNDVTKSRILDRIKIYQNKNEISATSFLDPREIFEYQNLYEKVPHYLDGGFEKAERKILVVGKDEKDCNDDFIVIIQIVSNKSLSHRDVLGSILGTGIKREVVGDIIIKDNIANVFISKEISKYVIQNLESVGREKVKVSFIKENQIIEVTDNTKEINVTVASLRIDSAISACYGVSRELSAELIKNAKVNLNYKEVLNASKPIKQGDLISVRGYGRFEILDILGETKKSRVRVKLKVY